MWSSSWPHGEPDEDFYQRMSAPENELAVALPQNVLLARTEDVAVGLIGPHVYTTGVSFTLAARARAGALDRLGRTPAELFWEHGPGAARRFLLGVEFADGRRVSNLPVPGGAGGVVLNQGGGGGGDTAIDQSWWLSPLPPEGPLRVVVRCPDLGIPRGRSSWTAGTSGARPRTSSSCGRGSGPATAAPGHRGRRTTCRPTAGSPAAEAQRVQVSRVRTAAGSSPIDVSGAWNGVRRS